MMSAPLDILKEFWGYDAFRPLQEEIILSVLDGRDTLALLPTGGGKSVCFQVPALMRDGLCLVVSPLIALMKDQVRQLRKKNITAFAIYSGMSRREVISTLQLAAESNCKFLYVSPERLETALFREYLPALHINLIAVDEAHCISQWGYDFRPPYLRIAVLRDELPAVPVLALTATATAEVKQDICDRLQFRRAAVFSQSFVRKNLSLSVFEVEVRINKIVEILQRVPGSAIVYCKSRRRTKEISDLLNMNGIGADFYHAGLPQDDRSRKQDNWIKDENRVMVCTNAFGMGIDKPDVRTVIHADAPDCLENYYQEAGRAGRDEKRAYAVLLYQPQDKEDLRALPAIHFPALKDIRRVYQALMNYLQVPLGTEQVYYDFDIDDFARKFSLQTNLVVYALKILEQEGWVIFNEQVFAPSTVTFVTGKAQLYDFEKSNPQLEPLVKCLLRTYSGIFDQPVAIHEKTIAGLLRENEDKVPAGLKMLQDHGIIVYAPKKEGPQLYLSGPRIRAEALHINEAGYQKRKQRYEERIDAISQYITHTACRSQAIARYFGETDSSPCGICDNCLRQKNTAMSREEFDTIHRQVISAIEASPVRAEGLWHKLQGIHKGKLEQVLHFLQSENKLIIDKDGFVRSNY